MDSAECSGSKPSDEAWAVLVPLDSRFPEFEIRSSKMLICSEITSTSDKHEWCQITRDLDSRTSSAKIKNISSFAILVDGVVVQSGEVVDVKYGAEIATGSGQGHLTYKFEMMPVNDDPFKKKLKIFLDADQTKCSICLNVWHDAVTAGPCLHNFCNGCFSEWLRRCVDKHPAILCPQCRVAVEFVSRNHFLNSISEDILLADASMRRSKEELALLDSYACIKSILVLGKDKKALQKALQKRPHPAQKKDVVRPCPQRSRSRSCSRPAQYDNGDDGDTYLVSEDVDAFPCLQCGVAYGGFRCNQNTVHLQCRGGCGGIIPSRTDVSVPQVCLGCDRAFCGAYWRAQGVSGSGLYPVCSQQTFKPMSEHTLSRIPAIAHERSQYEQVLTERCIRHIGKTVQDVISEWTLKLDNRELDRTRMALKHPEMITAATYVCNECYEKLVSFLLYWFRISLPGHLLPPDAASREDCWYGYGSRTQHHNVDHARKRNHLCRPTKGNN